MLLPALGLLAHALHHPRYLRFVLVHRFGIALPPLKFLLALDLLPILDTRLVQGTRFDRSRYRASRLALMPAIAKPTLTRQFLDVRKGLADSAIDIPQRKLTQPRRVHQQCATG